MRRKDREITDLDQIVEIIRGCDACRIALNDEGGYPYIVPLNFGLEVVGDTYYLWFHGANRGKKMELIARDNRATFEMDTNHTLIMYDDRMSCTMGYASVIGHGLIEIVPKEEKIHGLKVLLSHFHEDDFPINEKLLAATTVFRLRVIDMTGKRRDNVHPGEKSRVHGRYGN